MPPPLQSQFPSLAPSAAEPGNFDFSASRQVLARWAKDRPAEDQRHFAQSAAAAALARYWELVCAGLGAATPLRLPPVPPVDLGDSSFTRYAAACAARPFSEAAYQLGELYTALLPADYRARHGIYYTPPALVEHLLDRLEAAGVNWSEARVLDPACGGAAFAAYVACRMLAANRHLPAHARLRDLSTRLVALDLDPFAAWMSAVLLDVVCLPLLHETGHSLDGVVRCADTLMQPPDALGLFDLVVGNPPYGKVTLPPEQRRRFQRSLYGHANLYGVFTDLAVSLTQPGGLIGFVTPTSFLGGEYFKHLRQLLVTAAPPVQASFVADREGVFSGVLQETMLAIFRRPAAPVPALRSRSEATVEVPVEMLHADGRGRVRAESLGRTPLAGDGSAAWLLPRRGEQRALVRQLVRMPARLADYGFRVSTGQLVWNRHKPQFRDRAERKCHPVLWAECIQPDGTFDFRATSRAHRPFLEVLPGQDFLVNHEPCVLVQRTTSKEQARRLIATVVPNDFVVTHPGYVVENHVNMVVPLVARPAVSLAWVARLLNSAIVDLAFRCISGSVAVSAYELEALPLPDPGQLLAQARAKRITSNFPRAEELIAAFYEFAG